MSPRRSEAGTKRASWALLLAGATLAAASSAAPAPSDAAAYDAEQPEAAPSEPAKPDPASSEEEGGVERWALRAGGLLTTRSTTSGVRTEPLGQLTFAGGPEWEVLTFGPGAILVGTQALLGVGQETAGTRSVRVAKTWLALGGRAQAGYELGGPRFGLMPLAFLEAGLGGGAAAAKVADEVRYSPALVHWGRAGVGFRLRLWTLILGLDLGTGWSDLRFALSSLMSIGLTF